MVVTRRYYPYEATAHHACMLPLGDPDPAPAPTWSDSESERERNDGGTARAGGLLIGRAHARAGPRFGKSARRGEASRLVTDARDFLPSPEIEE